MTGHQLKAYRAAHKLSLRDVADRLQNVSYSTVSRWEANDESLPDWVSDRLFRGTVIPLPLETLQELLNHASETKQDFGSLLSEAIQSYLILRRTGRQAQIRYPEHVPDPSLHVAED